jgi:ElaB/YqjD/DUF883 family membrane-anchored ribosome-binding protein
MDEEKSAAGPELTENAERSPEQVRADIERTRAELGDTVAALAEKTDVKHQAKQAVDGAKETVAGKVSDMKQSVTGRKDEFVSAAQEATPESAGDAGQRARAFAAEHPLPLVAVGAFTLGWLIRSRKG